MDQTLEQIVDFVVSTNPDSIPSDVLDRARDILVDSLGCALGGRSSPAAEVAADLAGGGRVDGRGDGTVIGQTDRAPADLAAFWNSAMIRYLDFNDSGSSGGHPSDMLGAHLALASGATGSELLAAIVIGHEVYNRVTDRLLFEDRRLDHGYPTAIGVAAAGSRLLALTPEQTRHAVSFSATSTLALRAVRAGQLSHMKGFATALGAKDAVFHLELARAGLTAPEAPFEGRHGAMELMTGQPGPAELPDFDTWTILGGKLKFWPAAYNTHPSIWAGRELRGKVALEDISSVRLGVNRRAWHESGSESAKWDPQTRETADHSIPYLFARALIDGVIDEASFETGRIHDPEVRKLMAKIEVVLDPEMDAQRPRLVLGCRAVIEDVRGESHGVLVDGIPGDAETPLTKEQIGEKFTRLAWPILGERAGHAFETIWQVKEADEMSGILNSLVAST